MNPEPDAFVALLGDSDRRMRALAFSMLGRADAMDDALQDAYLKAFRAYPRFRGDSSFATWLGSIVYRTCIDHQRRAARRRAAGEVRSFDGATVDEARQAIPTGAASEDRVAAMVEARVDVAAAMARLSVDHRAILALVDLEDASLPEAAEVLGVPVGTAASRLSRARAALKLAVEPGTADAEGLDEAPIGQSGPNQPATTIRRGPAVERSEER